MLFDYNYNVAFGPVLHFVLYFQLVGSYIMRLRVRRKATFLLLYLVILFLLTLQLYEEYDILNSQ